MWIYSLYNIYLFVSIICLSNRLRMLNCTRPTALPVFERVEGPRYRTEKFQTNWCTVFLSLVVREDKKKNESNDIEFLGRVIDRTLNSFSPIVGALLEMSFRSEYAGLDVLLSNIAKHLTLCINNYYTWFGNFYVFFNFSY